MKKKAAEHALGLVESGMTLGLGTGSTADLFIQGLGKRREAEALEVVGVATSRRSEATAKAAGVPLTQLAPGMVLDLTVDGADEVDPQLRLIKGGGGALLWEKIVAQASRNHVTIADESKQVRTLGAFPLPVEVVTFGSARAPGALADRGQAFRAGAEKDTRPLVTQRLTPEGAPFITDEGHHIFDLQMGAIADPEGLSAALLDLAFVVDHGLFLNLTRSVVIAGAQGIEVLSADKA